MRRVLWACALAACGGGKSVEPDLGSADLSAHVDADGASIADASTPSDLAMEALPTEVVAAGYTTATFDTTSWSTTTIDTANTKKTGFAWYPWQLFGATTNLAAIQPNSDGTLTLAGDTTGPNGELVTATPTGSSAFVGTTFGGGAYFEAVLRFDPQDVVTAFTQPTHGWPSWWALPMERVLGTAGSYWNGDLSTMFDNHVELDFFEYAVPSKPYVYGGTLHNWYGVYKSTCEATNQPYCDWHTQNNYRTVATGTDFTQYHAYGFLYVPATSTTQGRGIFYFDRQPIGDEEAWNLWQDTAEPTAADEKLTTQPSWALSWIDKTHYFLVLGTGKNEPMTIERVSVWQKDASANQHF